MHYIFAAMTQEYAAHMVKTWKYEGEYSIYDYANEANHMLDPESWGTGVFAVLDPAGELIGELSIEFYDNKGNPTDYNLYKDEALINQRELWIGFGLRPDLVGQGQGSNFVTACIEYAAQTYPYRGEYIYLGVATFNQRAIKAYEKAGFEIFEHTVGDIGGQIFDCVSMRKKL
jgi:ribosomal-protein-alanine N-acetyltransferase